MFTSVSYDGETQKFSPTFKKSAHESPDGKLWKEFNIFVYSDKICEHYGLNSVFSAK